MAEKWNESSARSGDLPRASIVVPVRNEQGNIGPLLEEIESSCTALAPFEVLYVDDGSSDATFAELRAARATRPWLRVIRHERRCGQSVALRTGVLAARAPIIATLDGDGQNDPRYIPQLVDALESAGAGVGLAAGQRIGRKASSFKRFQSLVANGVRSAVLRDDTRDTGCGLKALWRDLFLSLPFFDALHRFLPALIKREGYRTVYLEVVDRPRRAGRSNYGMWDRLWVGILDLAGVWWLIRRRTLSRAEELSE
jgi:glycosyltransferase involved in cell wall biosynthesis